MPRHFCSRKPKRCPACGSAGIAEILWGYPLFSKKLEKDLKAGRITLGGCVVTGADPSWVCKDCGARIYKEALRGEVEEEEK